MDRPFMDQLVYMAITDHNRLNLLPLEKSLLM